MNRLLFEKRGDAVYLSHLDLMRVFQRAFKRADILIWHSQGFSPRAYVSIALPLPVGMESRCEILDFEIEDGAVELPALAGRLNAVLPAGIRVLSAYESARKVKELTRLQAEVTLEYDGGIPEGAQQALGAFFARESIVITKHSTNVIKEFRNYTYSQDKEGKWLNTPIDVWNHAIDAIRYVVMSEILGGQRKPIDRGRIAKQINR